MIRIECSNCGSKLNAKESLIGQVRPCPKCKAPITIAASPPPEEAPTIDFQPVAAPAPHATAPDQRDAVSEGLGFHRPNRLEPQNKYLVLGSSGMIAKWEGATKGWQLKTPAGFIGANRRPEAIPKEGDFVLVELIVRTVEAVGHRLGGIRVYRLAKRWALGEIAKGETAVLTKIEGRAGLLRDQKLAVRRYLRESYMPEFMQRAHHVNEFLSGDDFHSHTVMEEES